MAADILDENKLLTISSKRFKKKVTMGSAQGGI